MRMTTPREVRMRGDDQEDQSAMWSYVPMERRVPADHPLRAMRPMVDAVLRELSPRFDELYSRVGRPVDCRRRSCCGRCCCRCCYTIRSERLLMEQLDYNLLFRWFVGLKMDDPVWDADGVHQEPGAVAGAGRSREAFFERVRGAGARARPAVGRALHRGRHAAGGVGEPEELQTQGRGPGAAR